MYVVCEHALPEMSVFLSEFFRHIETETKVQDYKLVPFLVLWVWSNEDVSWVWITVNKASNKNLLCKSSNQMIHNCLFVKIVLLHFVGICDFETVDPLRDHDSLP